MVVCREVASALWWMRCGGSVASALWWMQWNEVLAVFVEGFLLTFAGGVVILKIHIWEHSGPFGYLIPIWRGGAGWLCEVFSFAIIVKGGVLCRGSGLRI